MAENQADEIARYEMEQSGLAAAISTAEAALAVSAPDIRGILEKFLHGAKNRVAELDKKIKTAQSEAEVHAREAVALAQMAEEEVALNRQEKETYNGFLKREFFTKKDFAALEKFYAKTWDRLSDGGKDEMSHRFWEGIRRNEYKFSDAPAAVREKETDWAYTTLVKRERSPLRAGAIPAKDRDDFIRAYESGDRGESERILGSDSFKEYMFRGPASNGVKQAKLESSRDAEAAKLGERALVGPVPAGSERRQENSIRDLSSFGLDGVNLVEVERQGSSEDLPRAKSGKGSTAPSFPG